jgi:hypothetical protein
VRSHPHELRRIAPAVDVPRRGMRAGTDYCFVPLDGKPELAFSRSGMEKWAAWCEAHDLTDMAAHLRVITIGLRRAGE